MGTAFFTMFYYMMQGRFTSMLMALWVLTLFGLNISGSHFNPCVTLAQMVRKKTTFGRKRRLLGVMYLAGQFIGGIIGACAIALLLKESSDIRINVMPAAVGCEYQDWNYMGTLTDAKDCRYDIPVANPDVEQPAEEGTDEGEKEEPKDNDERKWKTFFTIISETFGSFIYVLFFMISTDEKLRFSNDGVKNSLVIASSYIAS